MIEPRTFRFALDERGIGVATLDAPASLNALTFETYAELGALFRGLADVPAVKALVLTGSGRAFCSGGNVRAIIGPLVAGTGPERLAFTRLTGEVVLAMRRLPKPIIAAVNGLAVGGGAALALAADLRIAAPEARIGFAFARVGLSAADMGVTWLLPRVVGLGRATELLLSGEPIEAEVAERWGLYNRVVAGDRLMDDALALAAHLAAGPTYAHGVTKELLDRVAAMPLEAALAAESVAQQLCMQTGDFAEGYAAFVDRRPPRFGRG